MHELMHPSRRAFIRFLAGSPFLSLLGLQACASPNAGSSRPESTLSGTTSREKAVQELADRIASPNDAINVFDFREVAEQVLPPAHYGYLATGVDGDETLRANREGFERFDLRARRLVDVSDIDMSVELLGERWETPIVLAPVASQKAFHAEGELATARASAAAGHHHQLYPTSSWTVAAALIRRAEGAGCEALVLTVDLPVESNRETLERFIQRDSRDCETCHEEAPGDDDPMNFPTGWLRRKPMFDGLEMGQVNFATPSMTWDFIGRLRDTTEMQIIVKGIVRDDDAQRCVQYGADAIIVSNHGGRAEASGRSSIESLPEVVNAVSGRIPVLVDGGFRRGTDVLKALALGADAICIGRPYIWGLAAFGQEGVEKVLEILREELRLAMQLHGVSSVGGLDRSFVIRG
jgi:isopentenyl diphosphate isomerase/L-lactate dehydrogenase-like FMN-dependent dehydrogenase